MAADLGVSLGELVGNGELAGSIDIANYQTDQVGEPTLRDIVSELARPGRDPRREFEPPRFRADITEISDLKEDMIGSPDASGDSPLTVLPIANHR